jgi:hypothetical protein
LQLYFGNPLTVWQREELVASGTFRKGMRGELTKMKAL